MCSQKEVTERLSNRLVDIFEIDDSNCTNTLVEGKLMIKAYLRTTKDNTHRNNIRPPDVLLLTTMHMVEHILDADIHSHNF